MGSQFSFIYDIIVVAVLAAAVFSGAHKGFVSKVVGLAAGLVGFIPPPWAASDSAPARISRI